MIRAFLSLAVLGLCSGAMAQAPSNTTTAPAASTSAPAGAKKTHAQCKKAGVKGKQAMKDCMAGK